MALFELLCEKRDIFITLAAVLLIVIFYTKSSRRARSIPSGPTALPFFGNLLSLEENDGFLKQLLAWRKQHGSVFSVYMGRELFVIINGLDAIKEATCQTGLDLANKIQATSSKEFNPKRLGLVDTDADEEWKKQRKFAHTTLRGMGFGKVSLEPLILKEAHSLVNHLKNALGSSLDPNVALCVTASNIINQLLLGKRVEHDSSTGDVLVDNVHELLMASIDEGLFLILFPFLWPVLKYSSRWVRSQRAWGNLQSYFHEEIHLRTQRINASQGEPEALDFMEAYLINHRNNPEDYSLEAVDFVLLDLYLAGTETITTTLTWAVAYLAMYPQIQQKIHDEILNQIGDDDISYSHRCKLPYTEAAILEIQRIASVAPLVPRQASKDILFQGYSLPKGTCVLLNLWSLHHDPEVWTDPDHFKPERFLDKDGALVKSPSNLLPFSAGKRMCMGESFAKMALFLLFTTLVQQVKLSVPPGQENIPLDGIVSFTRQMKPFTVLISSWTE